MEQDNASYQPTPEHDYVALTAHYAAQAAAYDRLDRGLDAMELRASRRDNF